MPHAIYILFLFALGACIGSFLNVVVWRLPRGESLASPPSRCPKCAHKLAWYDNIPVFGWIFLRGKCRYCKASISARYPIIEAITGGLFVFYYVMFFMVDLGPASPYALAMSDPTSGAYYTEFQRPLSIAQDWPMYALYMFVIASLLAASLIDAELFIIPLGIPWLMAGVGVVFHTIIDTPHTPGALSASAPGAALAAGGGLGLACSVAMWLMGWLRTSFPQGEPLLEVDREAVAKEIEQAKREGREAPPLPPPYTPGQIRKEMRLEMLFLLPPLVLGGLWVVLTQRVGPVKNMWDIAVTYHWFSGMLGSVLGALVGAFVVWLTRILGTLAFGRVAMGLGDVHLMFGVGAVVGALGATVAFFVAPFFGILIALYMLLTGTRRELPYGPYLSLATAFVMLFSGPIADYLKPGAEGLVIIIRQGLGG